MQLFLEDYFSQYNKNEELLKSISYNYFRKSL